VHGHADALRRLLVDLGYGESRGAFRHDSRKAIFVGDFVDRGPHQQDVLKIARDMCEADTAIAVLGNHEFNAIAWATPDDERRISA
jgi:Calcineurin-like phosphoesterase